MEILSTKSSNISTSGLGASQSSLVLVGNGPPVRMHLFMQGGSILVPQYLLLPLAEKGLQIPEGRRAAKLGLAQNLLLNSIGQRMSLDRDGVSLLG